MKWTKVNDSLPPESNIMDGCNPYYWVYITGFGVYKAMYANGEWWSSYVSKLSPPHGIVTHWMNIENPQIEPDSIGFDDL